MSDANKAGTIAEDAAEFLNANPENVIDFVLTLSNEVEGEAWKAFIEAIKGYLIID